MKKVIAILIVMTVLTIGGNYKVSAEEKVVFKEILVKERVSIKPSIGVSYFLPNPQLTTGTGFCADLELGDYVFGIGLNSGNTNAKIMSIGTYTILPIYGLQKIRMSEIIDILVGGGYSINSHEVDSRVISYAESSGYTDLKEKLNGSVFLVVGAEIKTSQNSKWILKYVLNKAKTDATAVKDGATLSNTMESDLSGLMVNVNLELN